MSDSGGITAISSFLVFMAGVTAIVYLDEFVMGAIFIAISIALIMFNNGVVEPSIVKVSVQSKQDGCGTVIATSISIVLFASACIAAALWAGGM